MDATLVPSLQPSLELGDKSLSAEGLASLIGAQGYRFDAERAFQDDMEIALTNAGVLFTREHRLSAADRPDFFVDGIAIELKVKGTFAEALRQITRYAKHPEVVAIILVGTPRWVRGMPETIDGKPIHVVHLTVSFF